MGVRKFGIAALLAVQSLLVACAVGPGVRTTQVQNRRVEFSTQGQGAPVVVFESGLGDGLSPWNSVASRVAKRAQVLTYSRAGYDRSTASKAPREPATIAAELDELLQALSLRPPYVLVGHSIGALYVQAYAAAHPDRVAALVLVDPTHPDQLARMHHEAPVDAALVAALSHLFVGAMRAGFQAYAQSAYSLPAYEGPVIVLGAQRLQAGSTPTFPGTARQASERNRGALPAERAALDRCESLHPARAAAGGERCNRYGARPTRITRDALRSTDAFR
jgi:pimeloyl-ACP methyl ester carboxylesterase